MTYELFIEHEGVVMLPPIVDGVTIEWQRKGQPGKMTFSCVKTDSLSFFEGDACRFSVDGVPLFFGFVFEKARTGAEDRVIKVTAYDQLYYLNNKDYFQYENKTATEVVQMLANDFGLRLGALESTGYKIATRTEDNKSLFDIIQAALDATLQATGQLFVLYDKSGCLMLSNISRMKLDALVSESTVGDFDYKSSIANETYDKVRLLREGDEPVVAKDARNIRKWGVLQYVQKVSDDNVNLSSMANALLKLYNTETRTLSVKNVLGNPFVRAGSLVPVILGVGDMNLSNYMLVESVKHSFKDNEHLMDLNLRGGTFVA